MGTNDAGEDAMGSPGGVAGRRQDPNSVNPTGGKIDALDAMDHPSLLAEWRRLYRAEPPKRVARELLMLGVGWKLQEQTYGGWRGSTKRILTELSKTMERDGDVTRNRVAKLKPGARLIREWHGESHTVVVREEGFEWRGRSWRSLSVIARTITGIQWSGPRFFGLNARATKVEMESKGVTHA